MTWPAVSPQGMGLETLKKKADDLWTLLVQLETDKYDLEERQKRQDYDVSLPRSRITSQSQQGDWRC